MTRISIYLLALLFIGCAQKVPVTGGPKDTEAPFILTSTPSHLDTNVKSTEINMEFNEFIEANTLPSKLIVSPSLEEKPEVTVGNKKINISFQEQLKENTTYIINFNGNIKDITERNIIDSKPFVFSTGMYIDSASLKGTVTDALTLEPAASVWVLAYEESLANTDSLPWNSPATYLSQTNENGNFTIDYLAPGSYLLFALKEEDQNYQYNEKIEFIAFDKMLQNTSDTLQHINLKLFKEEQEVIWGLKDKTNERYGQATLFFPDTIGSFKISSLEPEQYHYEIQEKDSSVLVLLYDTALINKPLTLYTNTNDHVDTIKKVSFKPKKIISAITLSNNPSSISPFDSLEVLFSSPISSFDTSLIELKVDSSFLPPLFSLSKSKLGLLYQDSVKEDKSYQLTFYPKALLSHYGFENDDTLKYSFSLTPEKQYVNLGLFITDSINSLSKQKIITLSDQSKEVVAIKTIQTDSVHFLNIKAGNYSLKLISDTDMNKRWTSGNVALNRQPETILFYEGTIELKAGFDEEIKWIIKNEQ